METKLQNLTKEEKDTLVSFVGTCVFENIAFPSNLQGRDNITVQELMNNRTIDSLSSYGKFIKKSYDSFDEEFDLNKEPKKFGSITISEFLNFLKLVIKHKVYVDAKQNLERKAAKLKYELEKHMSPDEIKSKLQGELAELNKVLETSST